MTFANRRSDEVVPEVESRRGIMWTLFCVVALALPACAPRSSVVGGVVPALAPDVREGLASYYGPGFHGRTTASGTRFDMQAMVAAHPTYPFGTVVRVANLRNGRSVRLRIEDRGPAAGPRAAGVIVDVSYGAADALGFVEDGRTRVRVEVLEWGKSPGCTT